MGESFNEGLEKLKVFFVVGNSFRFKKDDWLKMNLVLMSEIFASFRNDDGMQNAS